MLMRFWNISELKRWGIKVESFVPLEDFLEEMYFMFARDCLFFSQVPYKQIDTTWKKMMILLNQEHQISQPIGRLVRCNFIVSSYKLTACMNHCISCFSLCDWYLFIKLKAINFLYKLDFKIWGKEKKQKRKTAMWT